ncbi:MAG: GSCFA domain-containing protein [Bacteroidales bacterium]|nr:GSCFA domain-containing protein [Bacteroidales bacterium]
MIKLQTPVTDEKCKVGISYCDKILMLGSCFSDSIGKHLADYGFDIMVNPFGTLYNPISILRAIERLSGRMVMDPGTDASGSYGHFTEEDCVRIGAGDQRWCSFSHHTSFARADKEEFLENANATLQEARGFFASCDKIIITLGTSWCFRHIGTGHIVSNCLKHPAAEFVRERLSASEVTEALRQIADLCGIVSPAVGIKPKQIIFTVSPIRHFKDGAHGNQISKSALLLGIDDFLCSLPVDLSMNPHYSADYFPSYEIVMDELRDYRFYAEDMCHPSSQTVGYIRDRFLSWALPPSEKPLLEENIRAFKASSHRKSL